MNPAINTTNRSLAAGKLWVGGFGGSKTGHQ